MQTPIYDMLLEYAEKNALRMHMPGHKGKGEGLFYDINKLDVTEISATDDLYEAKGAIKKAQELAAIAYGAKQTQFLTNGSTVGIISSIAACVKEGEALIADRGSHRAVISACMVSGCEIYYTEAKTQRGGGILPPEPSEIEKLLIETKAKTVFITSPNYYGQTADIEKIANLAHAYGARLIVDGAHGAHFVFSERLPEESSILGADIVIESAHKTLSALTQGAYLHINDLSIKDEVMYFLRAIQTSSPSFPIMASLDMARAKAQEAKAQFDEVISIINDIKKELKEYGIDCLENDDPLKLVVDMKDKGGGFYAKERLEEMDIYPEMADLIYVVFIITCLDTKHELLKLKDEILSLENIQFEIEEVFDLPNVPFTMSIRQAISCKKEKLPLKDAIGRISAKDIGIYPPGVPIIAPGQMITKEAVDFIEKVQAKGGSTFNIDEGVYVIK